MASTNSLQTSISGDRWWGGFTAEITLTNSSTQDLANWSYRFDSPHLINTAPWGAEISAVLLDNGLARYTLTGKDWGEKIPAGESVTIGFNGTQGTDLGNEGELTAAMLFGSDSAEAVMAQVSEVSSESSDTTTNPRLEPNGISKLIPSTALTTDLFLEKSPPDTSKYFSRFLTSNKFSSIIFYLRCIYLHSDLIQFLQVPYLVTDHMILLCRDI